jgi:hypothetical protein
MHDFERNMQRFNDNKMAEVKVVSLALAFLALVEISCSIALSESFLDPPIRCMP